MIRANYLNYSNEAPHETLSAAAAARPSIKERLKAQGKVNEYEIGGCDSLFNNLETQGREPCASFCSSYNLRAAASSGNDGSCENFKIYSIVFGYIHNEATTRR